MTSKIKYHTQEEAIQAVTQDGNELAFCTPKLKNNEDVVMKAITQHNWSFCHASYELKSNKYFIMKALNKGIHPNGLLHYSTIIIQSDIEVVTLALEKSDEGWVFMLTRGEAALNKELAAKALVKWGQKRGLNGGSGTCGLWKNLHPTLQEFFPKDSWYEKAQSYLYQLEQEKQAEMVLGGSTTEDGVVW